MSLVTEFNQINQEESLWRQDERLLLGISGGVDSMVLLDLWQRLPEQDRPDFAVAHINHQLRYESLMEEEFLRDYCHQRSIPFYCYRWEEGQKLTSQIESQARKTRYDFFTRLAQTENYQGVVTAHHGDDQGETFLMKVARGTQLQNLVSIRPVSQQGELKIYRPLLAFNQEVIQRYANKEKLIYFKDASNDSLTYTRNRIRHQVMPLLKAENDNFLQHIHSLVKQIEYANSIIADVTQSLRQKMIHQRSPYQWELDLTQFQREDQALQYMLLVALFQEVLIEDGISLQENHLTQVLELLNSSRSQGRVSLPQFWEVKKSYQTAFLQRRDNQVAATKKTEFQLTPGQGSFVSPTEYFYLAEIGADVVLPASVNNWVSSELLIKAELSQFPLIIRRADKKQRFVINQEGNTKEVRRLLIDEKVPHDLREEIWTVSNQKDILWIVPIKKSYLSIRKETDKIHYRLIYLKDK